MPRRNYNMTLDKMEYTWHMESAENQETNVRSNRIQGRNQGPVLIDELDVYMAPVSDGCSAFGAQQPVADMGATQRHIGGHQLPESPPDSGSENPYSPTETQVPQAIAVSLSDPYMFHDISNEMLQQNGDYIYGDLKSDPLDHSNINDVVVLHSDPNLDLNRTVLRHDIGLNDAIGYQNRYNQMRVEMAEIDGQGMLINPQLVALGGETLTPVYTSLQSEPNGKKRKLSQDVNSQVKCEPVLSPESLSPQGLTRPVPAPPSVDGSEAGDDSPFQCIRFSTFQQPSWHSLYDQNFKLLPPPSYVVGADKGFNYSQIDEAFVCQKKNHFQVTCQIQVQGEPHYVKTGDGFKKINNFYLHFYGVKAEDPTQDVRVEQSQSDRTKKPFHPVPVELRREGTKVTVGRLHFAETTNNNMRKKGRPNPDQRHFQLVVALRAHYSQHVDYIIAAHASDRIIVRASNPGQFESDCSENWWQRGVSDSSVHYNGRVGINTDRPDESLVVNGNLKITGNIVYPSDARAKHNIQELDTAQQLKNVQSIRVVKYNYDTSFAEHSGLLGFDPAQPTPHTDTGVIAQEVRRVIPEAVKEAGDVQLPNGDTIPKFLVVNKDRIFMENLGAVKELCKVTGNLESRVNHLEKMNRKLCKISILQRRDSSRSNGSVESRSSCASVTNSSKSFYSDGNISLEQIRDIARNIRRHEYCHKLSHNSPKYHRKQCKGCKSHEHIKYHTTKPSAEAKPFEKTSTHADPPIAHSKHEYRTLSNKRIETRLWIKNGVESEHFGWRNTTLPFCCRRRDFYTADGSGELISNKFLQVIITILIFVMAVCLVVMSALYFVEHRELISIHEKIRLQEKYTSFAKSPYGHTSAWPKPTTTQYGDSNRVKQMQNLKQNYNLQFKKETKGIHIGKDSLPTAPPIIDNVVQTLSTAPVISNIIQKELAEHSNYVKERAPGACAGGATRSRSAAPVGRRARGCGLARVKVDLKDDDLDCQSLCNLDPPQAYDNQEPLEGHADKELNDTSIHLLDNPQIPHVKSKQQVNVPPHFVPNGSENSAVATNEVLKEEDGNLLRADNATRAGAGAEYARRRRGAGAYRAPCADAVSFGVKSKSYSNMSLFTESVCPTEFMNFTYHVPISKCLNEKQIGLSFKSSKIAELKLCSYDDKVCVGGAAVNCGQEVAPVDGSPDLWLMKVELDCNVHRDLRLRAAFVPNKVQDLCLMEPEQNRGLIEYNIKLTRNCLA